MQRDGWLVTELISRLIIMITKESRERLTTLGVKEMLSLRQHVNYA